MLHLAVHWVQSLAGQNLILEVLHLFQLQVMEEGFQWFGVLLQPLLLRTSPSAHTWNRLQHYNDIQWKPLIMITLGPTLFDNNNRLITLSGGYKNLHYLTQFIVTTFYTYKKQFVLKTYVLLPVVCLHLVVPE
jgi:hypothetical protein